MTKYHFPTKAAPIGDGGGEWGVKDLDSKIIFFF